MKRRMELSYRGCRGFVNVSDGRNATTKCWSPIYLSHFRPVELSLVLAELLTTDRVRVPLASHSKADLLRELVALAAADADAATVAGILESVEAREQQISTAMGGGLAVPHGRTALVHRLRLAAGIVNGVADYASPDGEPVRVAFLVLTPLEATGDHVRVLSRIARVMHKPASRDALLAARSAEEFLDVLRASEVLMPK
jgi:mannitol/fructose-specific phosphotransferase system IIA component (Ntr-type)